MTDKVQKNQIADILLDFYDEYDSNVINRPMIPNIYAGKILDSMQEEPSEDLEEVAEEWDESLYRSDAFKAGAKWQKEQMMAKAVDGIARPYDNEVWCILDSFNLKDGDKVKVIVIKED